MVNLLSEFGPLIAMFIVNAAYGIEAGTIALMASTVIAIVVMLSVVHRLPVFPLIASAVTLLFGVMTLLTGDPFWIQVKVTIFNTMFGLFLLGGLVFGKNFFKNIFEKTFHYTDVGWNKLTFNFGIFFLLTAVANEVVRQYFKATDVISVLGYEMDGVNIWIMFKVAIIMPLSAVYAWWLVRLMQKYRIPERHPAE